MKIVNGTGRIIGGVIVASIGVFGSFKLKVCSQIGETAFVSLVVFFCVLGLFIAFIHRFESFTLGITGLSAKLAQIESTRQEVERREQSIRRVGLSLAQIAMFIAAFGRRATGRRDQEVEIAWLSKKASDLLAEIDATKDEKAAVFRYVALLPELDALLKTDEAKAKQKWDAIWSEIAHEIHPVT